MEAIAAKDLTKTYWFYEKEKGLTGSIRSLFRSKKTLVEAVRGVDLQVDHGELVGFIGPNGAGKTTTLKMLSGILHPTRGELSVLGFTPAKREKAFLKSITFLTGQRNRLFWDLPAGDYFELCRVLYELPREEYRKNLEELVELAEIGDVLKVPQRKLSFGQRKRCELVAALLHDPRVIFLDEPTNAVDLISARKIRDFIRERGKRKRYTILLTSHVMADIEQVCDRVVIINKGKIVFDGSLRDLGTIHGLRKTIKVASRTGIDTNGLERLGNVTKISDQEVLIEVRSDEVSAAVSYLFANFTLKDISISDPPLESTVAAIYLKSM